MKTYLLKNYIDALEKEGLVEEVYLNDLSLSTNIFQIAHNSKNVQNGTLYICKGLKYKPEYLQEAIKNGAILYVAESENVSVPNFPHIVVKDIRKALATISCLFYDYPATKLNMIGLTGTKGKSTTAYYIKSILDTYMKKQNLPDTAIISSIDTYDGKTCKESLITSPESIDLQEHVANSVSCNMKNLVMEVSSQSIKLDRIYGVLYKLGVFLNISEDHISTIEHPDFEDYFATKLEFFKQVETACVNLDSDYIDRILESANSSKKIITFSTKNKDADVYAYDIKKTSHTSISFKVKTPCFEDEILLTMPRAFQC